MNTGIFKYFVILGSLVLTSLMFSCKKSDPTPEPEPHEPTQDEIEAKWPATLATTAGNFVKIQRNITETFLMGSENGAPSEAPVHSVKFSKSFYMATTEVTQKLWKEVMGANPSDTKGDDLPVEMVSYNDIKKFIEKLNVATGRTFRLPTEAEWEYAARGGVQSKGYAYAGGDDVNAVAWNVTNSEDKTHAVGTKGANELGLFDMSGNVSEICGDKMSAYPATEQTDPVGKSGSTYAVRGGGFDSDNVSDLRTTAREGVSATKAFYNMGFRLLLEKPLDSELLP